MNSPLSFHNVSFGYHRTRPLLQDASFELQAGRITIILGPNGIGKTTLLYLTLGWFIPWKGEIRLAGKPLASLPPRVRGKQMALVPQTEHTPFDYTVLEYILLGRAPYLPALGMPTALDYEVAFHALEQVGLHTQMEHAVPQLSGGERQLMLLARAITQLTPASTPGAADLPSRLLLLDEPTAHLDLNNKARLIEIVRDLRRQGVTILMSTHEPDVALAVADNILAFEPGVPLQFGSTEEIFTSETLSRIYHLPIRLIQIDGRKQVLWT